jgi:hypothetical protein
MTTKLLSQIVNPAIPTIIGNAGADAGGTALGKILGAMIGGIMIIALLLAFFLLISGGISWLSSGGDKNQLESARNKITNAIIGLIIVFSVWAVMLVVGPFVGLNFPTINIPAIQP